MSAIRRNSVKQAKKNFTEIDSDVENEGKMRKKSISASRAPPFSVIRHNERTTPGSRAVPSTNTPIRDSKLCSSKSTPSQNVVRTPMGKSSAIFDNTPFRPNNAKASSSSKSIRRSADMFDQTSEAPSNPSTPHNCSHPPIQKIPNSPMAVSSNNWKLPYVTTPKSTYHTPIRSVSRSSTTNVRLSIEESGNPPIPNLSSVSVSVASPQRMSEGSSQKNNTPNTPSSENARIRRSDVYRNAALDIYNIENIDESSPVSVGVRVRPLNNRELARACVKNIVEVTGNEIFVSSDNGNANSFAYDHCFWSCDQNHGNYASQQMVYDKMARPLLDHAFEGYNVCLFAYGQTGSGKSYCIMGEGSDLEYDGNWYEEVGVIPRFCSDLFQRCASVMEDGKGEGLDCRAIVEISYIEIYNEKIYDLIGWQQPLKMDEDNKLMGNCTGEKREALRVREHPQNGPYIVGASHQLVTSYQDLQTWIILGNKQRSIASTGMNDKSSRSHSVFSIKLTQRQVEDIEGEEMGFTLVSSINLVDLAGSERVAASHSEGDRLKEGVCINKSLLTLGKVITALAESNGKRKVFIPYRESVLTWLLKESLGGNSKTSMIATISPCNLHREETLSTLRYAHQARKIVNWNHVNEDPAARVIRSLKLEVERLRAQHQSSSPGTQIFAGGGGGTSDSDDCGENILTIECKTEDNLQRLLEEERRRSELHSEREKIEAKQKEIETLRRKLKVTQDQFTECAKDWEQKLKDAETRKKDALEMCRMSGLALKIENNEPTLVNLCEDPQLSQTLLYSLREGSTSLGQMNTDVTLSHLHGKNSLHCTIKNDGGRLMLYPAPDSETFVNGKLTSSPIQIYHNDRIVLSGIYYFRVSCPSSRKDENRKKDAEKFDFYFARDELLRAQEDRIRKEMASQQAATRAELLRELEDHRELLKQSQCIDSNFKLLTAELEQERKENHDNELMKLQLKEEKQFLEERLQNMNQGVSFSFFDEQQPSGVPNDRYLQEVEAIFNESMQIVESDKSSFNFGDVELWFLITEANSICKDLRKSYEFKIQSQLVADGLETFVLVVDSEHQLTASLSLNKFKDLMNILRDLSSGNSDDSLFETSLVWERKDEATHIPFLVDKLKESMRRLSMNSSFNASNNSLKTNSQMRKLGSSRRRSSIYQTSGISGTITVAKALSSALLKNTLSNSQQPIFDSLISDLSQLNTSLKAIRNRKNAPLSEDQVNAELVSLVMITESISKNLKSLGSLSLSQSSNKSSELQSALHSTYPKLRRKVVRMLQGVETEVESLVDEECISLKNLIQNLSENIGFLSVAGASTLIETSSVASSVDVCQSYVTGVSKGLEWQIGSASQAAKSGAALLLSPLDYTTKSQFETALTKSAQVAAVKTAQFLDQLSQLKVDPSIDPDTDSKRAMVEANRFLTRVGFAADNARQLMAALATIMLQLRDLDQGTVELCMLGEAIVHLQEALGELIDDAGVGGSFHPPSHESVDSSQASVDLFLETLHKSAIKSLKSVMKLSSALTQYEANESHTTSSVQVEIRRSNGARSSPAPLKSSFKNTAGAGTGDEKRVRFNVTGSFLAEDSFIAIDTVNV